MNVEPSDSNAHDQRPVERGAAAESRFRGLPAFEDLKALASTYLEQHRLWPGLVGTPALPEMTDTAVAAMADAYEAAYRSGQPQNCDVRHVHSKCVDGSPQPAAKVYRFYTKGRVVAVAAAQRVERRHSAFGP